MRKIILFIASLALPGCVSPEILSEKVDQWLFQQFGGLIFDASPELSTKDLHLDSGGLIGQRVIVRGEVLSWGEHGTHLVLGDQSGRLLVVTTGAIDLVKDFSGKNAKVIRVYGKVERGKKGLPYLFALAAIEEGENNS